MNKKNMILFVGAGASGSFGKPTTSRLKDILHAKYGDVIRVGFLRGLLSCPDLLDFEYTLAAAMEIRDFLNSPYGGKTMTTIEPLKTFVNKPTLDALMDSKILKEAIDGLVHFIIHGKITQKLIFFSIKFMAH